jgi:hypothetical protein
MPRVASLAFDEFDEDLFVLDAEDLHLADTGNAQEVVAQALGDVLELRVIEAGRRSTHKCCRKRRRIRR